MLNTVSVRRLAKCAVTVSLATSAGAFVSASKRGSPATTSMASTADKQAAYYSGAEDAGAELTRLRRENDRLKSALGHEAEIQRLSEENEELKTALSPAAREEYLPDMFGLRQATSLMHDFDRVFSEGPMGFFTTPNLLGSMTQGAFSMAGPLLADTRKDLMTVQHRVEELLVPKLGKGVKCSAPIQHSYASSIVDGKTSKSAVLICRAKSEETGKTSDVQVVATLDDESVMIDSLMLDGKTVELAESDIKAPKKLPAMDEAKAKAVENSSTEKKETAGA